jgi:hypothetical protein
MSTHRSLWEYFQEVPDPRSRQGRRYPLPAVLTLTAVGMLAGVRSLYALAQFGRDHGPALAEALGFDRQQTPCCTTLHYLFRKLDVRAFEAALDRWRQQRQRSGHRAIALDGKTLRGVQGDQLPGVHLLAGFDQEAGEVLGQVAVAAKTNEHKAALELLELIPVAGQVITGDAMFCQKDLSRKILQKKATISGRSRTTSRP